MTPSETAEINSHSHVHTPYFPFKLLRGRMKLNIQRNIPLTLVGISALDSSDKEESFQEGQLPSLV